MLLALILVLSLGAASLAEDCPGNTFNCGDGCIPEDWTCDGAPDCNNGKDEDEQYCGGSSSEANILATTAATVLEAAATTESPDYYTTGYSFGTTDSTLQIPVCSESKRKVVEKCYEKIGAWVEILGQVDLNVALFTSSEQIEKIERSCTVYQEFKECLGDIYKDPSGCILPEALDSWDRYETYTCQLLLPSAVEHNDCFQQIDNHSCSVNHYNIQPSNTMANFCKPIFSVKRVLDCAPFVQDSCSADSRDFLAAIRSETSLSDSLYACSDSIEISGTFSMCPRDLGTCKKELKGVNVGEIISLLGNLEEDLEESCQAYVRYRGCMSEKIGTKDSCWPTDEEFTYMEAVFSTYCSSDILEGISNYSSCLSSIASNSDLFICKAETIASARGELSTCRAMQNLLRYLDCGKSIVAMECESSAEMFVEMVHGRLSDQLISFNCDYSTLSATTPASERANQTRAESFSLAPAVYPRCTTTEETGALSCLLGLFELQQLFGDFSKQNIFMELANKDSLLIKKTCSVYTDYESCLDKQIFANRGGRCSFSANINKMARIGLGPLCDNNTRANIQKHRGCMQSLQDTGEINQCGSHISKLGRLIVELISGGSDYTLCRVFYLVRELFLCIEPHISATCGPEPLEATRQAKQLITDYGVEEGCPAIKPLDFDSFVHQPTDLKKVPLDPDYEYPEYGTTLSQCMTAEHAEFNFCLRPLGQFKPNALSVIGDPRRIGAACEAYRKFHECRMTVSCKPAWSAGIDRMYEYVCDDERGRELYKTSKACLRRLSQRSDMKECVQHFTQYANDGDSCAVSNRFLSCSYSSVMNECGAEAARFVSIFIMRFALGTDLRCIIKFSTSGLNGTVTSTRIDQEPRRQGLVPVEIITRPPPKRPPIASMLDCSAQENATIQDCEKIMFSTVDRIKGFSVNYVMFARKLASLALFDGGIGAFISNMNVLAEIFAEGCDKSATFQECARLAIHSGSSCTVGSCVIRAGDGVCEEEDREEVIKTHLNCVFSLISEPEFGKCIRSTFTGENLSGLTLESLKKLVPKFVNCASGVISRKCGEVPVNILRSVGSKPEECILDLSSGGGSSHSSDVSTSPEPEPEPEGTTTGWYYASGTSEPSSASTDYGGEYDDDTTTKIRKATTVALTESAAPETTAEPTESHQTSSSEPTPSAEDEGTSTTTMSYDSTEKLVLVTESQSLSTETYPEPESTAFGESKTSTMSYTEWKSTEGYAEPETSAESTYSTMGFSTMIPYTDYSDGSSSPEPATSSEPYSEPESVPWTPRPPPKTPPPRKPVKPGFPRPVKSGHRDTLSRITWISSLLCWITGLLLLSLNQGRL